MKGEMPKMEPYVHIKKAKNGWVVNACTGENMKTYVYETLEDALSEIKGVFSVADEEAKESKHEKMDED